ncbi:MAG: tetratricopeptide repeat protein [Verrucomicrobia bacterium]|nr:tetratricopeptide repeat protein [Verrucomicrobiota bacterium]
MVIRRKNLRACGLSIAIGFVAIALRGFSAEHPASGQPNNQGSSSRNDKSKRAELESDLTFGKSTSEILSFGANSEYQAQQSAEAIQKLQKVHELRAGSNDVQEVTRLLREILTSGARQEIKSETKKLAWIELVDIAEAGGHPEQALQFLAEYIELFPKDAMIPEVLLRQGYILRNMGAYDLAISKFYLVNTAATRLPADDLLYSQRVTLTAQAEIAETTYAQGKYKEAASFYEVLLKNPSDELNRLAIKTKLIRAHSMATNHEAVIRHALEFLEHHGASEYQAEVRYRLAAAYKGSGQKQESLRELMRLLEAVEVASEPLAGKWRTWKMSAGNDIGNQLFLEGDYTNAAQVYRGLVALESSPNWQLPIYYQLGLCFEKLLQPAEALKAYNEILALSQKTGPKFAENLQIVVDMARFRADIISWKQTLESAPRPAETKVAEKAG